MTTQIKGVQIKDVIAGDALTLVSGILDVGVDGITIEVSGDVVQVKVVGIDHGSISGLDDGDHDARYYTETEIDAQWVTNSGTIDHDTIVNTHNLTTDIDHNTLTNYAIAQHRTINDSATGSTDLWSANKITTVSGNLQTNIDAKDDYQSWSFAVDGVTKDTITSSDVLDFIGSGNVTITRSADDKITISGTAGAGDIAASDYSLEDESSNCDGSTVAVTLGNTVISGSFQVYLNCLIQQTGSGND